MMELKSAYTGLGKSKFNVKLDLRGSYLQYFFKSVSVPLHVADAMEFSEFKLKQVL